jgi:hypothetical protein
MLLADFSLKGCQIVAGGRSEAQTTGMKRPRVCTLEGCHRFSDTLSGCGIIFDCCPVVFATLWTTGYCLTALQADIRSLHFTHILPLAVLMNY